MEKQNQQSNKKDLLKQGKSLLMLYTNMMLCFDRAKQEKEFQIKQIQQDVAKLEEEIKQEEEAAKSKESKKS